MSFLETIMIKAEKRKKTMLLDAFVKCFKSLASALVWSDMHVW